MAKQKTRIFAVFGLGSFGQTAARVLTEKGGQVIAIDNNPEIVESFKNSCASALLLDSTDEKAVAKAPLDDVDTAIIAIDTIETSILTTALLKNRGVPYIVARSLSEIHTQVLKQIGANEVINLQVDGGRRVAQRLIAPDVLDTIPITADFSLSEINAPALFVGKPSSSMELEKKFGLHLSAIRRTHISLDTEGNPVRSETLIFPDGSEKLADTDVLIIIGKNGDIETFTSSI